MTKKKMFRVLAMLLALTVLFALTACNKSKDTAAKDAGGNLALYNLRILTAGDQPPDQQTVFDEVQKRTKDTLNINLTVDYIPWADYIEKVRLMSAAKEKFDIALTFSGVATEAYNRHEMIALDDLLAKYGKNLTSKILPSNWVWARGADGKTIAVPCQYAKDGIYTTLVIRKDLRLKYGTPEITDWNTLGQFLDAVVKNDPNITPLLGGSIAAATTHEVERLYNPIIDYGYQGQGYNIGFWETTGPDAYKVKNWYADVRAQEWMKLGAEAMNRGWYAKDLNAGENGYDQTAISSGRVAALQMDYYNFNTIYNNAKQTNPSFELEWALVDKGQPVPAETDNNFAQVSATSGDPARAVMFLDWIQASQDNYDLWYYGIKGKHYTLSPNGEVVYPAGSVSTALPYAPTPWYFRNYLMDRTISTDSDMSKTAQEYWKNVKILDLPDTAAFVFDTQNVQLEITQVNTVIQQYWNDLSNGVLQGDANYQKFLKALDDAGMPSIMTEMQKQLDTWRAANLKKT
jgi:putative aldouronate transport system substrate-binding protein